MTSFDIFKSNKRLSLVQDMASQGILDVKQVDDLGDSPLIIASRHGAHEIVTFLLEQENLDVNLKNCNGGATALGSACLGGHVIIAEALIRAGAHVNQQSDDGSTPLLWACFRGDASMVEMLLGNNADPTHENQAGYGPHWAACRGGFTEIVNKLARSSHSSSVINTNDNGEDEWCEDDQTV